MSIAEGTAKIKEHCGDTGQSKIQSDGTVPIRLNRLDNFVKEDVLLLKIDTEGHEMNVLKGATGLFENFRVENILTEMKPQDADAKVEWLNGMREKGYKVWNYCEHYSGCTLSFLSF